MIMLKSRMILCLLMNNAGIFHNSRNFSLQPVGELVWIKQYLNFMAIDELVLLNVSRKPKSVNDFALHMRALLKTCFAPVSAGGGINNLDDIAVLLDSGADKVVINSSAFANKHFISQAAEKHGSQCIVVSIDVKKNKEANYKVYSGNGQKNTGHDVVAWAREVEALGAGEIFLTSIDNDGVGCGYDLELLKLVTQNVGIPVIASGGVGEFSHLTQGVTEGKVQAVSAANIFHYIGEGLSKARQHMMESEVNFPMWNFM